MNRQSDWAFFARPEQWIKQGPNYSTGGTGPQSSADAGGLNTRPQSSQGAATLADPFDPLPEPAVLRRRRFRDRACGQRWRAVGV
jgi:hypothetical protein